MIRVKPPKAVGKSPPLEVSDRQDSSVADSEARPVLEPIIGQRWMDDDVGVSGEDSLAGNIVVDVGIIVRESSVFDLPRGANACVGTEAFASPLVEIPRDRRPG